MAKGLTVDTKLQAKLQKAKRVREASQRYRIRKKQGLAKLDFEKNQLIQRNFALVEKARKLKVTLMTLRNILDHT